MCKILIRNSTYRHTTILKIERIPVGCVPPALYTTRGGGSPRQRPPWTDSPRQRSHLDRDPPGQRPPWIETPLSLITTRKWSLRQGNIFTPVCHSVHRGGLPQCMMGYHTTPPNQAPPPGPGTPRTRHHQPPGPGDPPNQAPLPPGAEHAGR